MQEEFYDSGLGDYDRSQASGFWDATMAARQAQQLSATHNASAGEESGGFASLALDSYSVLPNAIGGAASSIVNLGTAITNSMNLTDAAPVDWKVREMQWVVPKLGAELGQFFVPYTGAVKALGAASKGAKAVGLVKTARVLDPSVKAAAAAAKAAAKTGNATKSALNMARAEALVKSTSLGFAVDYATYDLNEERLADMVVQIPGLEGLEDIIGHDEDDSVFMVRLKNSMDGAFFGVAADFLLGMHQSRKAYKAVLAKTGDEGKAVAAGVEALDNSVAEAAVRREKAYDDFVDGEMVDFHFPEGQGGDVLADDMHEARRHIDEATAAGMEIGPDGTARPRALVEDAEGNVTELSDAATARLEADEGALGSPRTGGAEVADADGNVTELSDEATARLEADAETLGTAKTPKEVRPNLAEGRRMEYDAETGNFSIHVDGATRAETHRAAAKGAADFLDGLEITPEMSGEDILRSIQEHMNRTDIPLNPRAKDPSGSGLVDLPDDVSRNAANLTTRQSLLENAQNARGLLRSYEDLYQSSNWGAKLSAPQLQELVIAQMDLFGNLTGKQRREFIRSVGTATTDELKKNTGTMMAFGQISNDYTEKASKMVDDLLQHEDMPNSEQLLKLAETFEALGESHQHFTDHKSVFGVGLRAQVDDVIKVKDRALNRAMDACGLKP